MSKLRITKHCKQQEWNIIITIPQNIGFPLHIIHNWKKKLINKHKDKTPNHNKTTNQKLGYIPL